MGTRHLIAVQLGGEYRVAQYGQWDGYPDSAGIDVLFYGYKIVTDKGDVTLAFRNLSNGYYGGSIEEAPRRESKTWRSIADDWSA
jgi:hypothetical protein